MRATGDTTARLAVVLLGATILAGLFFRVDRLDAKVFWDDETYTAMRALGATEEEWLVRARNANRTGDLRRLLHPGPDVRAEPVAATIRGLAAEEPQHAPLYFVAAHYWVRTFGDATLALRSLSLLFGCLALPAAFWFGYELFPSRAFGWACVATLSISPVSVLYAQEAREYSLWTVMLLIAGAAFLRAERTWTLAAWGGYALALAVALYVYPLTALFAVGHAIYLFIRLRERTDTTRRSLREPLFAFAAAFAAFAPWGTIMLLRTRQIAHAFHGNVAQTRSAPLQIVRDLVADLRHDVLDFDIVSRGSINLALGTIAFVAIATLFRFALRERKIATYIGATVLATVVPVVVPDLFAPGERSQQARYFMPFYIDVGIALAYASLAAVRSDARGWKTTLQGLVCAAILAAQIATCSIASTAATWWNKYNERALDVAATIDATSKPLLVADGYLVYALVLSNYLDPTTPVVVRSHCLLCNDERIGAPVRTALPSAADRDVFLLEPTDALVDARAWCIGARVACAGAKKSLPLF